MPAPVLVVPVQVELQVLAGDGGLDLPERAVEVGPGDGAHGVLRHGLQAAVAEVPAREETEAQ